MEKKIKAKVKLLIPGGQATPAPPIGSSLAPYGVNLQEFCKQFNDQTKDNRDDIFRVIVTVYDDRSFTFEIKEPPVSYLIKKAAKIDKGSGNPPSKVAQISLEDVKKIAQRKMKDFNTDDLNQAMKMVIGTAKSMGIEIVEN